MAPMHRRLGDPPPQYGPLEELFWVEINHGGLFCGSGINKTYIDCRTEYFNDCDVESWSPLWLGDFLQQLGYVPENVQVYWLLPRKHFNDGLRIIESDSDTLMMTAVVPKFQYFKLKIKYVKNDLQRVRAKCDEGCPWYLYAAPDSRFSQSFAVKNYVGKHTCEREWELKLFTAKYLAAHYIENFRADDKMTLRNFARLVQNDFNMTPSRSKLSRARRLAICEINGDEVKQYEQLWDYAAEVRHTNPGSTIFMRLKDGCFSSLYMSLDACKRGFMSGFRPLICVDGCHIKTKYGGQLLTAVGVDPNDCIFPIAMAVVEVEDTQTWKWFLNTFKEDLGIENTGVWTLMSDRQKGLINVVNALFPKAEHHFCVRHLYQNFNKKFKGENLKNKLWAIARSYNMLNWRKNMDEMKALSPEAYDYLEEIDQKSWCRALGCTDTSKKAFFNELPKPDLLLNNTCEVFNKYIMDARELPMRSMLEKIKNQLMTRIYSKNVESNEWAGIICPKIRKKLDKQVEMSNNSFAKPALKGIFQVAGLTGPYTVDLNKIDQKAWQKTNGVLVKPPIYEKHVGRPSKKRRKNPLESEDGLKMSKHGSISHCSLCNSTQHNKRKCPNKGKQGEAIPEAAPRGQATAQGKMKKLAIRRNITYDTQESGTTTEDTMTLTVQQALMHEAQASQLSQVLPGPGPLPES
ncbi:hypothetical protein ACQ4PT_062837 [Festuca glaucescens]